MEFRHAKYAGERKLINHICR